MRFLFAEKPTGFRGNEVAFSYPLLQLNSRPGAKCGEIVEKSHKICSRPPRTFKNFHHQIKLNAFTETLATIKSKLEFDAASSSGISLICTIPRGWLCYDQISILKMSFPLNEMGVVIFKG